MATTFTSPADSPADVTGGFDLRSEIGAAMDSPSTPDSPATPPTPAASPAPDASEIPAQPDAETPAAAPQAENPAETPVAAKPEVLPEVTEQAAPSAELPEGVTVRTVNGHKEYVIADQAAGQILNAYQTAQAAEEILGVPLSAEVVRELYDSHVTGARIENDLTVGGAQGAHRILDYFTQLARNAVANGETQQDGMLAIANYMPSFLAANHPQAFSQQYNAYMRYGLDGLYQIAADSNDPNLRNAVAWIDQKIFNTHRKADATPRTDPLTMKEQDLNRREQDLRAQQQRSFQQRWASELEQHNQSVKQGVADVIAEYTKNLEAPYKSFPKTLARIRTDMEKALNDSIAQDPNWVHSRNVLLDRAAASPANVRKGLLQQVANLYQAKARIVLNPARNQNIRAIMNEAAALVKSQSDNAIDRANREAAKRQPGSGGATPNRPVLPAANEPTGFLNKDELSAQIAQMLG